MYVRLAFAVAAHLDPDILIIDEVLAVGDAAFQKKCLNKMKQAAREGRTVLFVSHSMQAVQSLCSKAVLLEKGKVVDFGSTEKVYRKYSGVNQKGNIKISKFKVNSQENAKLSIDQIEIFNNKKPTSVFKYGDQMKINLSLNTNNIGKEDLRIDINVLTEDGFRVACFTGNCTNKNSNLLSITIPTLLLSDGIYSANVSIVSENQIVEQFIQDAFYFEVEETLKLVSGASNAYYQKVEVK
jgi:lipopolysaccharide transport system ATP-binding protein